MRCRYLRHVSSASREELHMISKKCCRLITYGACGMYMLQFAGCTIDSVLQNVISLTLSALLTELLSTPVL